jgi:exonuclease SbcC
MALGLSDLIVRSVRVDTMFIDEGFDTLDNERLDSLLNSLTKVTNRQIGIITHVDQVVNGGMIESKILVRSCEGNSTRSEVVVLK